MGKTPFIPADRVPRGSRLFDAKGKVLGRLSTQIAVALMGKDKPEYHPAVDCGDFVVVINCAQVRLTGRKLDQKKLQYHSLYPDGFKEKGYREIMQLKPELAVRMAVERMLPKNKLGSKMKTRLRLFRDAEHKHAAQKPVAVK
ncbi:MAG TPA: 50S ribosomal protein L13 [bacterium]|nr:50S ribosomal protein L13 [bacterium]